MRDIDPVATDTTSDRGTAYYIWTSWSESHHTFSPIPGARRRSVISVPIDWELRPDPVHGVVLWNAYGLRVTAAQALQEATGGDHGYGFRLVEETSPDA